MERGRIIAITFFFFFFLSPSNEVPGIVFSVVFCYLKNNLPCKFCEQIQFLLKITKNKNKKDKKLYSNV